MADYSNLRVLPPTLSWFAEYRRHGLPLYDEMLLEAVDLINPQLFSDVAMRALRRELNPAIKRGRGRPPKLEPTVSELLELVRAVDRSDVPDEILDSLASRLESGEPFTMLDWQTDEVLRRRGEDRVLLICGFYRSIYNLLEGGPAALENVFGKLELGYEFPDLSRHEQATVATGAAMRHKYGMNLPGPRRIANIVSSRKLPKTMCVNLT